jgi:hypothetical protein
VAVGAAAIDSVGSAAGTAGGEAIARAYNLNTGPSQNRVVVPLNLRYMLVVPDNNLVVVAAEDNTV